APLLLFATLGSVPADGESPCAHRAEGAPSAARGAAGRRRAARRRREARRLSGADDRPHSREAGHRAHRWAGERAADRAAARGTPGDRGLTSSLTGAPRPRTIDPSLARPSP